MNENFSQEIIGLYQSQLEALRHNGQIFSRQNPDIAQYLDFNSRKNIDPQTQRLVEAFAFLMAQLEYKTKSSLSDATLNLICRIFPEVISPRPAFGMLKIIQTTPRSAAEAFWHFPLKTAFSALNRDKKLCTFQTLGAPLLHPFEITSSFFATQTKVPGGGPELRHALIFDVKSPTEVNLPSDFELVVFVDLDFSSTLELLELVNQGRTPIFCVGTGDVVYKLPRNAVSYHFDMPISPFGNTEKNALYPLYDFLYFYPQYFAFRIKLGGNFQKLSQLRVMIPLGREPHVVDETKSQFLATNVIPVVNAFERDLDSIRCQGAFVEQRLALPGQTDDTADEILDVVRLKIYDEKTGYEKQVVDFHKRALGGEDAIVRGVYWASRREFSSSITTGGDVYIRLFMDEEHLPSAQGLPFRFAFPTALCTNGVTASEVRPQAPFTPRQDSFGIQAHLLGWPLYHNVRQTRFDADVLQKLFLMNERISEQHQIDLQDLLDVFQILGGDKNLVLNLVAEMKRQMNGVEHEYTVTQVFAEGNIHHIPTAIHHVLFKEADAKTVGLHFLMAFLNHYAEGVRRLNTKILFKIRVAS